MVWDAESLKRKEYCAPCGCDSDAMDCSASVTAGEARAEDVSTAQVIASSRMYLGFIKRASVRGAII